MGSLRSSMLVLGKHLMGAIGKSALPFGSYLLAFGPWLVCLLLRL